MLLVDVAVKLVCVRVFLSISELWLIEIFADNVSLLAENSPVDLMQLHTPFCRYMQLKTSPSPDVYHPYDVLREIDVSAQKITVYAYNQKCK